MFDCWKGRVRGGTLGYEEGEVAVGGSPDIADLIQENGTEGCSGLRFNAWRWEGPDDAAETVHDENVIFMPAKVTTVRGLSNADRKLSKRWR